MANITLDDIRNYVKEKGPKRVKNVDGLGDYLTTKITELMLRISKEHRISWFREDIPARIQEILPIEGQVILSGRNGKVIIYDENLKSYREAAFDILQKQPVPTQKQFELDWHNPQGPLESVYFSSGAATFLEKALELFDAPVVEIGKHIGDSCNRYFSMKKYF